MQQLRQTSANISISITETEINKSPNGMATYFNCVHVSRNHNSLLRRNGIELTAYYKARYTRSVITPTTNKLEISSQHRYTWSHTCCYQLLLMIHETFSVMRSGFLLSQEMSHLIAFIFIPLCLSWFRVYYIHHEADVFVHYTHIRQSLTVNKYELASG